MTSTVASSYCFRRTLSPNNVRGWCQGRYYHSSSWTNSASFTHRSQQLDDLRGCYRRLFSSSSSSSSSSSPLRSSHDVTPLQPHYTLALTREVPDTFPNAITHYSSTTSSINLQRAKEQHQYYVEQLSDFVEEVVVLPPLNHLPDSVFVEDTVVVVNKVAIMTRPGHESRRDEVHDFKLNLREHAPSTKLVVGDMNIGVDTTSEQQQVICDGGDVLYTGRHMFVGLSSRTNQKAFNVLKQAFGFEDDKIVAVQPTAFSDDALHLKSVVTAVDSHTLLAPTGPVGDQVLKEMDVYAKGYNVVRLPSMLACNIVSANGGLLAQDGGCLESRKLLEKLAIDKGLDLRLVDFSEFAKCDGALTCCSVLLNV
jgi:dimethylargininase